MRKFILILSVLSLSIGVATAQSSGKAVGYDDIQKGTFYARGVFGLRSMSDGEHFLAITPERGALVKYRYVDGSAVDTIFNNKNVEPSFAVGNYQLSDDENLIMFATAVQPIYRHSYSAKHWYYNRATGELKELSPEGNEQVATFSPDGSHAAFVRANNIYVVELASGAVKQVTFDGKRDEIINGHADWVHEEEIGFTRGYEWSPASDAIAYYRFDEREVKKYHMPVFDGELYPDDVSFKYPKAGERNADVQIKLYRLKMGSSEIVDSFTADNDGYFPRIEWTGRENELALHKLSREQNSYELVLYNTVLHSHATIFTEKSARYIDGVDGTKITFLPEQNRFFVLSEADGYRHIYLYDMTGKFQKQVTNGEWEVTSIDGIDYKRGRVYFTAAMESPLRKEPYVIGLRARNAKPEKLSSAKDRTGTYGVHFSNDNKYYIQTFSNVNTPTITTLHATRNGKLLRTLEDNAELAQKLDDYALPVKRFITVMAADGVTELNGYMLMPLDFDENKKYPLLMTQYSGPGSQSVADRWGVGWETALLKEGYLVACVDGRGTGFRGFDFKSCTYKDLGKLEVEDQIAAAEELGQLPFVDDARIGIYGWSYGGFMALNCILKGSDVFSAAISIAPVTSWRYYDTIYTERYNGDPNENPEGYDENSPIYFAENLKGSLLLVHGTADDNVHIQNTYDMISAFNRAGKKFDMLIYPDANHSMGAFRHNLMRECIDFLRENL